MANLSKRDYGFLDDGFVDFYNMLDSFFNDDFHSPQAAYNTSFKVDVSENDDSYLVEAEMPGFDKDDIEISLDDDTLTLRAKKDETVDESDEDKKYIHKERRSTEMSRSMRFDNIDPEKISAKLDNGILSITLPKLNKDNSKRKISID